MTKSTVLSTLLASAFVLLTAGCVGPAQPRADNAPTLPAPPASPASRADVLTALAIDDVPADYVILVDTSSSMAGDRYAEVKSRLREFVSALSPHDRLWLYTFDIVPTAAYVGPVTAADQIIGRLPASLPSSGRATDIGAALDRAVGVLEQDANDPIAAVVLLTDGENAPAAGSAYPTLNSPAWAALRARSEKVTAARTIGAYAVPLDAKRTSGAELLLNAFSGAEILDVAQAGDTTSYLDRPKEAVRTAKAKAKVQPDAGQGVEVSWSGQVDNLALSTGAATVDLTLRSTLHSVPIVVSGLRATSGDGYPVTATLQPGPFLLAPGASARVPATLTWDRPSAGIHLKQAENRVAHLTVTAALTSPWDQVLSQDLKVNIRPILTSGTTAELTLRDRGGLSRSVLASMGAAVLFIATVVGIALRLRPRMDGVLVARTSHGGAISGSMRLRGHSRRLRSRLSLSGSGRVKAKRIRNARGELLTVLHIRYSPDGSRERRESGELHYGQSAQIGAYFEHLTPAATQDTVFLVPAKRSAATPAG